MTEYTGLCVSYNRQEVNLPSAALKSNNIQLPVLGWGGGGPEAQTNEFQQFQHG